jgi:hypothetical protein
MAEDQEHFLGMDAEKTCLLLKAFQGHTACWRNTPSIGHQAVSDAVTVRDELSAKHEGVIHAGILVLLRFGALREECGHGAKQQAQENNDLHVIPADFIADDNV